MPVSSPCNEEILLAPSVQDDEELVDHEATPGMHQRGAQRDFRARGAEKSANGNLPHDVSIP